MSRRRPIPIVIAAVALLSTACTSLPNPKIDFPEGVSFVPQVADSIDDVGLGNDIAVGADGRPFISYFGFEATLQEGEIPVTRPVGAAFLPAAQVASLAVEGYWIRGAVAQAEEFPAVDVPFGPTLVESLSTLEPDNSNGTSIAVGDDGSRHVVWAANDGIWFASSDTSSSAEQVSEFGGSVNLAGPIGRPSVAVDGVTPWIAWTERAGVRHEVHVATLRGERWRDEVVATISPCAKCPPPPSTEVGITPEGPIVIYVDPAAQAVMAARRVGAGWESETVASRVAGLGLSMAVGTDGTLHAAYYSGEGTVELATNRGASWTTTDVGTSGEIDRQDGNFAQTTGLAVEDDGTVYVSWYDAAEKGVRLADNAEGDFKTRETVGTRGGSYPSLAVTPDGSSIYLAWYDTSTEDLIVGVLAEVGDLVVAQPSPAPEPGPLVPTDCGVDVEPILEVSAETTAFSTNCLVAPAGEEFTITFDNQDTVNPHNIAAYIEEGGDVLAEPPAIAPGPIAQELTIPAQEPGSYYFNCQAHPTQMTGTLAVVESRGGGN